MALLRNRLVLGAGLLVMLLIVGRFVWNRYGTLVSDDPRYALSAEKLHVTPAPEWVQSDVTAAAIRTGKLDELSLLDRDLVSRVDEAFRLQTWVAEVEAVTKTATGVDVELRYREPIAMVEIFTNGSAKLQPVDAEGVLLPGAEFSQTQAQQFLRIAVPQPRLHGLIDGTQWPDERVVAAAEVAGLLFESRQPLHLFRINMLLPDQGQRQRVPQFEIETTTGQRVVWGSPPSATQSYEASADDRLAALQSLEKTLTAKAPKGQALYDVRTGTAVLVPQSSDIAGPSQNPWGSN